MSETHFYEVNLSWDELRKGTLSSPVVDSKIEVVTPPEFSKGIAGKWSPEHLFLAAVNACMMTTFLAIADNLKLEFSGYSSKAIGKLETFDGKMKISEIELHPILLLAREEDRLKAERILAKSESNCLISNSVSSKITLHANIQIASANKS